MRKVEELISGLIFLRDDEKWIVNIFSSRKKDRRREEMILSKRKVKEIKGPLTDLVKQAQDQPEHHLLE